MASSLSSLGIGSDGVLSYDVIDQLREVDEAALVTPLETKITENENKSSDLSLLTTFTANVKSATSTLADELTYLDRDSSVSGTSVSVTAEGGTSIQDFTLNVTSLATKDIYQSASYSSESSIFANSSDTIQISIDSSTFEINVDASTTISELKDMINEVTDGKIIASVLNVGGDNPYKLILKSNDTGEDNSIQISSTNGAVFDLGLVNYSVTMEAPNSSYTAIDQDGDSIADNDTLTFTIDGVDYDIEVTDGFTIDDLQSAIATNTTLNKLLSLEITDDGELSIESISNNISVSSLYGIDSLFGLDNLGDFSQSNHIQTASDATFEYNGILITRDSNSIDDLIVGVSIELLEIGTSNVEITQNSSAITDALESLVSSYNELMSNLNETITYDTDSGTSGTLQGVSEIITLKSEINRQLLSIDSQARSLTDYGLTLNDSGYLEFDIDTFNEKMKSDSKDVEDFFRGITTINDTVVYGSNISAGTIDLSYGDFKINDTNIIVSLSGTAQENAIALKNAINSADIYGVEAYLDDTGSYVYLKSTIGENIQISGDNTQLSLIGFKAGTTLGTSNTSVGIFSDFNDLLNRYIDDSTGILSLLATRFSNENDALEEEKTKTIDRLDTKYEIMANRFAEYDSIISSLTTQFNTLSMMIEQSYSSS